MSMPTNTFKQAIAAAAEIVRAAGKPVGTLLNQPGKAVGLLNGGFSFVACDTDAGLLVCGADSMLQSVRDGIA